MSILIPIALFGWIPVILFIFSAMPPRRAVLVAFITAWLFLPYSGYSLPALPDYTKRSATCLGIAIGTILFRFGWLVKVRPRWFDLPMAIWCACPMASSISNGLGLYDGISAVFDSFVSYGLPYIIGKIYFTQIVQIRELAISIVVGGLIYIPFCLYELRMSPVLHMRVYGFDPSGFGEVVYGGYRPKVFLSCGLELGVWMTAASTIGIWLWASQGLKQLWGFSFGWLLAALLITTVLCKVAGAWILLLMGASLWYLLKASKSPLPAIVLALVPVLYMSTRASGLWSGDGAVELVRTVLNERRAESLQFRMSNENLLVGKALQHPIFGWGGWGDARVYSADGNMMTYTDGMWVIALGNHGLVGLISFNAALLLPMVLLIKRCPVSAWQTRTMAPVSVLTTLLTLYSIDCIANAMLNPIYYLALGGVTGVLGTLDWRTVRNHQQNVDGNRRIKYNKNQRSTNLSYSQNVQDHGSIDPREETAARFAALGRELTDHGRLHEAKDAWHSALQHWAELAADYPDDIRHRECWLDGLNDAAWSLVALPGHHPQDVSRAVQLAEQVIELEPGKATYWNTLGIAYLRAGRWEDSVLALERSVGPNAGGTSFDYFCLAIACFRQGDRQAAWHWYKLANEWMEKHKPLQKDLLSLREEACALMS